MSKWNKVAGFTNSLACGKAVWSLTQLQNSQWYTFILVCVLLFPKQLEQIPSALKTVKSTLPKPEVQDTLPHLQNVLVAENHKKS